MSLYIEGIQSSDALEFTANYTKSEYSTLAGLRGTETTFAIYFGTDGTTKAPATTNGAFYFKGYLSVRVNGGGVNEVVTMTISIAPSSAIGTTTL